MFADADKIGRGMLPEENRDGGLYKHARRVLERAKSGGEPVSNFIFAGVHPPPWIRRDYLMERATADFVSTGREAGELEKYMLGVMSGHEALWIEAQLRLIEILRK